MAETIKSVLFLDYDSVRHALEENDSNGAERLGLRLPAWIAALESGSLLTGTENEGGRRRLLMRRCYADPSLLDADRAIFLTNGFQVVDCPTAEGRDRNAAAIHMVLDTIDALDHPAGYEEFILLSADTDLSPILIRLRAHNRSTAIYANPETAESYKAIADALIDETRLISVLVSDERPKPAETVPPPAERSEIEALARKVSTATSVPLFAPRTFAELFRHLVEEIAEKGYHHQTTAENVAARMASGGRNVTRRQVVFVVKGLALKGHVFSTSDTPERLAEVFREQVQYLCENAQLGLGDRDKQIMAAWIVGRVQPASAGAPIETEIAAAPAAEKPAVAAPVAAAPEEAAKPAPKPADDPARAGRRGKPMRPVSEPPPKPEAAVIVTPPPAKPVVEPPRPAPAPPKQAEPVAPPPPLRPAEEPKPAVRTILSPKTATPPPKPAAPVAPAAKPATIPPRPATLPPKPAVPAMPAATLANRPLPMPPTKPLTAASPRPAPTPPPRPAPAAVTPPAAMPDGEKDAVESSILAAIAQAVDVLVEDGGGRASSRAASVIPAAPPSPAPEPEPYEIEAPAPPEAKDEPEEERHEGDGDDIGDEIQRIIASYNRTREQ